jgi:hypothetical protein
VLKNPPGSIDPGLKNIDQCLAWDSLQKIDDRVKKLLPVIERLAGEGSFEIAESPEVRWCETGTAKRLRDAHDPVCFEELICPLGRVETAIVQMHVESKSMTLSPAWVDLSNQRDHHTIDEVS